MPHSRANKGNDLEHQPGRYPHHSFTTSDKLHTTSLCTLSKSTIDVLPIPYKMTRRPDGTGHLHPWLILGERSKECVQFIWQHAFCRSAGRWNVGICSACPGRSPVTPTEAFPAVQRDHTNKWHAHGQLQKHLKMQLALKTHPLNLRTQHYNVNCP